MRPFHDLDVEKDKKTLTWAYVRKVLGSFVHYYTPQRMLFFLSLFSGHDATKDSDLLGSSLFLKDKIQM